MTLDTEMSQSLLSFLLESGLQVALLIPIILAIQVLAGNRISPTTKHALWLIVMLRLSLPIFPESQFSFFNFTPPAPSIPLKQTYDDLHSIPSPDQHHSMAPAIPQDANQPEPIPDTHVDAVQFLPISQSDPELSRQNPAPQAPIYDESESIPHPTVQMVPTPQMNRPLDWTPRQIAFVVWVLGFVGLLAKLVHNGIQYQRLIRSAEPIQDPNLTGILTKCADQLSLTSAVKAIQSPQITSPAIFGFLQPRLLLPTGIQQQYTLGELHHIILHELAHIRRWDPLWNWWASLVQIVHWPNPLVWYAVARQRGDRELATDYLLLRSIRSSHPQDYGHTLIKALEGVSKTKAIPGLIGIGEDRRGLTRRFRMIGDFRSKRRYSMILLLAIVCPLLLGSLTDPKTATAPTPEQT